jgi:hypothetical protein
MLKSQSYKNHVYHVSKHFNAEDVAKFRPEFVDISVESAQAGMELVHLQVCLLPP